MKVSRWHYYVLVWMLALLLTGCGTNRSQSISSIEDLNQAERVIGGQTGSAHEPLIAEVFPKAQEKQFSNITELLLALDHGQVDAFVHARESLESVLEENPGSYRILGNIGETQCCMVVSPKTKYPELFYQVNEFLAGLEASGELSSLYQKWMIEGDYTMPDISIWEDGEVLSVGTSGELVPNSFYEGNELIGYDIELTLRFAYAYHYKAVFRAENVTARMNDTEFGKVDMLSGGILKTPERAERVLFPDTALYTAPVAVLVKEEGSALQGGGIRGLLQSLEKTLLRENRWKMILSGLAITLLLSAGALVLGSFLGFVFCMGKRSRLSLLSGFMQGFIALMDGIPVVLVLMICFYLVFSHTGLSEIPVAIIAFSLAFGCRCAIILDTGMNSVDKGEVEAAQAMGMSGFQVFRKIQFPQAVGLAFDMYKAQVVAMIKNTSIVGYIAVQDLTKVSDIIRARTYDSFFSLVFTALIYFLLARICLFLLGLLGNMISPKRHSHRRIRKGGEA